MDKPKRVNQIDHEVPRRTDLNPFRDYRPDNSKDSKPPVQARSPSVRLDTPSQRSISSRWVITLGLLLLLGFVRLGPNPLDWFTALTEVRVPMTGTIIVTSTSCAFEQDVRITPLTADGDQDGTVASISVEDEGDAFPVFNAGCTITFETEIAKAHAYDIAVPGIGQKRVAHDAIDLPNSPALRVNISL